MRRKTNSHDVAQRAGVSRSTVSLVLNGRTDVRISEETRQRVLLAAQELHYSSNAAGRALVTGHTFRVGVVPIHPNAFLDQGNYYADLFTGLMRGTMKYQYDLLLHVSHFDDWHTLFRRLLSGGADGVALIGRPMDDPLTLALLEARYPTVCISYRPEAPEFHAVDCDNEAGGYLAVRHLLSLGHRRIAVEGVGARNSWGRERCEGARRAIHELGLPAESLVPLDDDGLLARSDGPLIERIVRQLKTAASPPITGHFLHNEGAAQRVAEGLRAFGIRVPDDVAVVSFDSTAVSERAHPALTSIWQPLQEIGEAAVDLLVAMAEGHTPEPGVRCFPVRLDIRQSCGASIVSGRSCVTSEKSYGRPTVE